VAARYGAENATWRCRSQFTVKLLTTTSTRPCSIADARSATLSTTYWTLSGLPKIAVAMERTTSMSEPSSCPLVGLR